MLIFKSLQSNFFAISKNGKIGQFYAMNTTRMWMVSPEKVISR